MRLVDPNFDSVQPDDKVALAMSVCEEIMGKDDRIISANASYSDEKDFKYMVASNGFEGEASGSLMVWWGVSASVGRATPVPSLIGTTLPCIMTS